MLPIHYQTILDGTDVIKGWLAHPLILCLLQKSRIFSCMRVKIIRSRLSMVLRSKRSKELWGFVYFRCREVFLQSPCKILLRNMFSCDVKIFLETCSKLKIMHEKENKRWNFLFGCQNMGSPYFYRCGCRLRRHPQNMDMSIHYQSILRQPNKNFHLLFFNLHGQSACAQLLLLNIQKPQPIVEYIHVGTMNLHISYVIFQQPCRCYITKASHSWQ